MKNKVVIIIDNPIVMNSYTTIELQMAIANVLGIKRTDVEVSFQIIE